MPSRWSRIPARGGRVAVAAVVAVLAVAGTALAAKASIKLTGLPTVALGTTATFTASGYFSADKAHPYTRPNFAEVVRMSGTINPTANECTKHGKYTAGGVSEKKWRAKTPTTPGHFSTTFNVKGDKAGSFTLCGLTGNYPVGGILKRPLAVLHYTVK